MTKPVYDLTCKSSHREYSWNRDIQITTFVIALDKCNFRFTDWLISFKIWVSKFSNFFANFFVSGSCEFIPVLVPFYIEKSWIFEFNNVISK